MRSTPGSSRRWGSRPTSISWSAAPPAKVGASSRRKRDQRGAHPPLGQPCRPVPDQGRRGAVRRAARGVGGRFGPRARPAECGESACDARRGERQTAPGGASPLRRPGGRLDRGGQDAAAGCHALRKPRAQLRGSAPRGDCRPARTHCTLELHRGRGRATRPTAGNQRHHEESHAHDRIFPHLLYARRTVAWAARPRASGRATRVLSRADALGPGPARDAREACGRSREAVAGGEFNKMFPKADGDFEIVYTQEKAALPRPS